MPRVRRETGDDPFRCPACQAIFRSDLELQAHSCDEQKKVPEMRKVAVKKKIDDRWKYRGLGLLAITGIAILIGWFTTSGFPQVGLEEGELEGLLHNWSWQISLLKGLSILVGIMWISLSPFSSWVLKLAIGLIMGVVTALTFGVLALGLDSLSQIMP
jgi:uncharacterized C2H2 Zn-finger protein